MSTKQAVIQQVQQMSNQQNARQLVESINEACFAKCVPKPGTSLSSTEEKCVTSCMEKYMAAWNVVSRDYIQRLKQEQAVRGNATL